MRHLKARSGRRSRATKEMTRPCRKYRRWHLFGCASCMRCRDGATPSILPACHLWLPSKSAPPPTHLLASLTATTRFTGNPVLPACTSSLWLRSQLAPPPVPQPEAELHSPSDGLQRTTTDYNGFVRFLSRTALGPCGVAVSQLQRTEPHGVAPHCSAPHSDLSHDRSHTHRLSSDNSPSSLTTTRRQNPPTTKRYF